VIHDKTFHTILVLKILQAGQFDIESACLYEDLEEKYGWTFQIDIWNAFKN
jgi:hypothetical protein